MPGAKESKRPVLSIRLELFSLIREVKAHIENVSRQPKIFLDRVSLVCYNLYETIPRKTLEVRICSIEQSLRNVGETGGKVL